MNRVTIKDVARHLGVNISTVSRALSNHPNVLPETKRRVVEAAQQLGYVQNQLAANLRRKHSGLVALILADLNMFFLPSVIRAVEEAVRASGFHLIILQSNNSREIEAQNVQICCQLAVEGVMVGFASDSDDLAHFQPLIAREVPIVFFDKVPQGNGFNTVRIDDSGVAAQAARHLIEKGCREIVGIFGGKNLLMTRQRLEGFQAELKKSGIKLPENRLVFAESIHVARERLLEMLPGLPKGAAVFAMSDELMVGAVQAIESAKLKIPDDVAVICFSDGFAPDFYRPKISHILHSGYEVGTAAWKMLEKTIRGEPTEPRNIEVACRLVEGESV